MWGNAQFTHLPDIDACILLPLGVSVPQFSHDGDGVEPRILCQSVGNDLQGLGKAAHTVGLHARQSLGEGHQLQGHLDLWSTSTSYQCPERERRERGGGGEMERGGREGGEGERGRGKRVEEGAGGKKKEKRSKRRVKREREGEREREREREGEEGGRGKRGVGKREGKDRETKTRYTKATHYSKQNQRHLSSPPVLDEAAYDTESVVQGAIRLLQHQLVGASHHHRHRAGCRGDPCDLVINWVTAKDIKAEQTGLEKETHTGANLNRARTLNNQVSRPVLYQLRHQFKAARTCTCTCVVAGLDIILYIYFLQRLPMFFINFIGIFIIFLSHGAVLYVYVCVILS